MLKPTASCSQCYRRPKVAPLFVLAALAAAGAASPAEATSINLGEFSVTRNGGALLDDSFSIDGRDSVREAFDIFQPVPMAVPELSTWTMMLIGFAGLGYAAKRHSYGLARRRIGLIA